MMMQTVKQLFSESPGRFKRLKMSGSVLKESDLQILASALEKYQIVKSLEIANCYIEPKALEKFLKDASKYGLSILVLNNVQMGDDACMAVATAVQECSIRKLDLSNNRIGPTGAKALAVMLGDSGLHHLYLGNNEIGEEGGRAIATALATEPHCLKTLDLRMNRIGDGVVDVLSQALVKKSITCMQLDCNSLTTKSVDILCSVLPETVLESLFLGWNDLPDAALARIGECMKNNQANLALRRLYFHSNLITTDGIESFSAVMKNYDQLEVLDMRQNHLVTSSAGPTLLNNVQGHLHLGRFLLSGTGLESGERCKIEQYVEALQRKENRSIAALVSPKTLTRLGVRSQLSILPVDLIRCVKSMLG